MWGFIMELALCPLTTPRILAGSYLSGNFCGPLCIHTCVCVCVCVYIYTHTYIYIHTHTLSQEKITLFWEVLLWVIVSKNVYMYMCLIPRGFPDRAISLFYVYSSVHHNIFYEITNRCSYMQSILFHC